MGLAQQLAEGERSQRLLEIPGIGLISAGLNRRALLPNPHAEWETVT